MRDPRRWLIALWRRRGRRAEDTAALGIYVAAWLILIGRVAVAHPGRTCACGGNGDPTAYMWALAWWPHALVNGLNPFLSHVIWTPEGGNVASSDLMPGAALLMSPVTAAFGPVVAYNLLSLLGPVLAAWLTFRLCRYVTGRWLPSVVGGYIFGFSSYVLGHSLGHVNLILIFLVPVAVHLVLLWLDGRVDARRFVALMTGLLTFQFLLSTELLLTMLAFGGVALLFGHLFTSPLRRRRIRDMIPKVLLAGVITALLVSPYLYYALTGLARNPSVDWVAKTSSESTDPLNYVLPTRVTWVGHGLTQSLALQFEHGNDSEAGAYVGLPLLFIVALFLLSRRRRASVKVLFGMLVALFVGSLGAHLHILNPAHEPGATYTPSIPLPWGLVGKLPVLDHVIPARLSMYIFLLVGLVVAQWLSEPARWTHARWLLAGVGIVLLIPNQGLPFWRGRPVNPPFFAGHVYRTYLKRGETVLVLPYGGNGNSMLWQAETSMYFRMAEGYVSPEVPLGYWRDPMVRILLRPAAMGPITPEHLGLPLEDFIIRRRIGAVILGSSSEDVWKPVLASLHLLPARAGRVFIYDVPSRWRKLAISQSPPSPFKLLKRNGQELVVSSSGQRTSILAPTRGGFLDSVTVEGRTIALEGWAASRDGPPDQVVAFIGGRFLADGTSTRARPDVARALGQAALISGFSLLGVSPPGTQGSQIRVFALRGGRALELTRVT